MFLYVNTLRCPVADNKIGEYGTWDKMYPIVSFLAKEVEIANQRKKEANERRRLKKQEERERKAEKARQKTVTAAESLLNRELIPNISLYEQL